MAKRCTCPETTWKKVHLGFLLGCTCGAMQEERAERAMKGVVDVADKAGIKVSFQHAGTGVNMAPPQTITVGGGGGGGGSAAVGGKAGKGHYLGHNSMHQEKWQYALSCASCSSKRISGWIDIAKTERCLACPCPTCGNYLDFYNNGKRYRNRVVCAKCKVEWVQP